MIFNGNRFEDNLNGHGGMFGDCKQQTECKYPRIHSIDGEEKGDCANVLPFQLDKINRLIWFML